VIIGVAWRPPLASVGLLAFFIVLLAAVAWTTRRLTANNIPSLPLEEKRQDDNVLQQMIRSQTSEGLNRLDGTFLVKFPAKAMTTTVHIPFCPAFERVPKVQAFPVDEADAQLRIVAIKMFGVRIDVKRSNLTAHWLRFAFVAEE